MADPKKFRFTLTGVTPLLLHADDVEKSDAVKAWQKAPENKGLSVAGDDRSPPWIWQTYCYTDGKHVCVPSDNLSAALRQAGGMMTLKGNKTFKEASQAGLFLAEDFYPIDIEGKHVTVKSLQAIADKPFAQQASAVESLGFTLFVKRAKVGNNKHVRVRARFDTWQLSGTVEITSKEFDAKSVQELFELAGKYKGIGDWRPGSPKSPGRFGRFSAELKAD